MTAAPHPSPTPPDAAAEDPAYAWWTVRAFILIAVLGLFRTLYLLAAGGPLDLAPDESYYWDWSRQLDWGYYSKPPAVAWILALSTGSLGPTEFAVRLPAVIFGTLGLLFLFLLARRLFDPRVGFWTVVLAASAPAHTALNLVFTIDAPALAAWTATLWCLWRALATDDDALGWWAGAGLAGACALLSKQTSIALPALTGLFVLLHRADWRRLARPGIWLYGAITALGLIPTVLWNARHGWITLEHTTSHFADPDVSIGRHLARGLEFVGSQVGVYGPVTFGLLALGGGWLLVRHRRASRAEAFLVVFSVLPLAGVFGLAFLQRVLVNWPAPFYAAAFVLAAAAACGAGALGTGWPGLRRARRAAWISAAGLSLLAVVLPFALVPLGLAGSPVDPLSKNLRGWKELAEEVERARHAAPGLGGGPVLVAGHRQVVSALAFYLPDRPRVYRWNGSGRIDSQYELWTGPDERRGSDFLVLSMGPDLDPAVAGCFARIEPLGPIEVPLGGRRRHAYFAFAGRELTSWPPLRSTGTD